MKRSWVAGEMNQSSLRLSSSQKNASHSINSLAIRGVIFDVGGTLMWLNRKRFIPGNAWAAANWLRARGLLIDAEGFAEKLEHSFSLPKEGADFRQINTTRDLLLRATAAFDIDLDKIELEELERIFYLPEIYGAQPLPGIMDVIKNLQGHVRHAVISNTRSHLFIEGIVKRFGLQDAFDPLVTSVSCGYRKPSPHIFRCVLEVWGLAPEEIVMIGDSPHKDMAGAKALGLRTIWLKTDVPNPGPCDADVVAEMPQDILAILVSWDVTLGG